MIAALIIFMILCVWLLAQHIRSILELRSICGQLEEMERGSHMELGVYSRRREVLKLCRTLNRLQRKQERDRILYENLKAVL